MAAVISKDGETVILSEAQLSGFRAWQAFTADQERVAQENARQRAREEKPRLIEVLDKIAEVQALKRESQALGVQFPLNQVRSGAATATAP